MEKPNASEKHLIVDLLISDEVSQILSLSGRQKLILKKRFVEALTLEQIGKELNISNERVRQIYQNTIFRIRKRVQSLISEFTQMREENISLKKSIQNYQLLIPAPKFNILMTKIQDSTLSPRAKNSLKHANIITINDLVNSQKEEISHIRSIGIKTVSEIDAFMLNLDLKYKDE